MPHIQLRIKHGIRSPEDLTVSIRDATFEYLMTSPSPEIRVSAYLDQDCPKVESHYSELFLNENCRFDSRIVKLIPGSKTRKNISLPGPMQTSEQLIVIVARTPLVP